MSVDGYLDDASPERLLLSGPEDFARVDLERAEMDAILVGANTIRKDNPRLMVRSSQLQEERVQRGLTATPVKVTLTATGNLDPSMPFFTTGDALKLVYTTISGYEVAAPKLEAVATVVRCGEPLDLEFMLDDLFQRGIRRLMVEGGSTVHTQLLTAGLADELQISVAPFFVGDSRAVRFVGEGVFPFSAGRRMVLAEVAQHGDCALLRYLLP
jgi:5-amino-6-(5-phosphoribosylamino)uracil reductase